MNGQRQEGCGRRTLKGMGDYLIPAIKIFPSRIFPSFRIHHEMPEAWERFPGRFDSVPLQGP